METETIVFVELAGKSMLVGRLWSRTRKGKESATFEYDKGWLVNPQSFALDPALGLGPGPFHTERSLFGAIGDSAPDRWGRILMRRAERRRAEREGQTPRTLREIDYLLQVDDEQRQGALRFAARVGGPFLAESRRRRIPPLVDLPQLLAACENVVAEKESDEDLQLLLAPGSSLGGARPKSSVRDLDGQLAIAKFPSHNDEVNVVVWEAVALTLADRAGLVVPDWRLEFVNKKKAVLILRRFDRLKKHRIPFTSALSMLSAADNEQRSYLELVDVLRQYGASAQDDMRLLWRRVVFNILISNTDDHLRNHGFLLSGPRGWRLAPAYDLNPVPVDLKPRVLSTAIDLDEATASLELALEVAGYFELSVKEAKKIAREVAKSVKKWRTVASGLGIPTKQIDRMASAFEHDDLRKASA